MFKSIVIPFLLCSLSFVVMTGLSRAEVNNISPDIAEGAGILFTAVDDLGRSVSLVSSEEVSILMQAASTTAIELVSINIQQVDTNSTTELTINGLSPLTTYYRYEDGLEKSVTFTTDENGGASWIQDISISHALSIQDKPSTLFIRDDVTGGDCSVIGLWDQSTKTCTLQQDLAEGISIVSDGITLDGNGYTISTFAHGVYVDGGAPSPQSNGRRYITIKNLTISGSLYGLYLRNIYYSTVKRVTISNCREGMWLFYRSNYNTIENNIIRDSYGFRGVFMFSASGNSLTRNTIDSTSGSGIEIRYSGSNTLKHNNIINNNYSLTTYNGGVYLYGTSGNVIYDNYLSNHLWNVTGAGRATWNTAKTEATNIIGGPYIGGNYWGNPDGTGYSDLCTDVDPLDGICDGPYELPNNEPYILGTDFLPLTIYREVLPVEVELNPQTLNLSSNGQWVTAYIEAPEGYTVDDIIQTSAALVVGEAAPIAVDLSGPHDIGDNDGDGVPDLMVKFLRDELIDALNAYDYNNTSAILTEKQVQEAIILRATLVDGTQIEGADSISIIRKVK